MQPSLQAVEKFAGGCSRAPAKIGNVCVRSDCVPRVGGPGARPEWLPQGCTKLPRCNRLLTPRCTQVLNASIVGCFWVGCCATLSPRFGYVVLARAAAYWHCAGRPPDRASAPTNNGPCKSTRYFARTRYQVRSTKYSALGAAHYALRKKHPVLGARSDVPSTKYHIY